MRHRLLLQAVLVGLGCCALPSVAGAAARCSSGGSVTVYGFTDGATLLSDTSIPVCETGRVDVRFSGGPAGGR